MDVEFFTHNEGKLKQAEKYFNDSRITLHAIHGEVDEDGKTLIENVDKKSMEGWRNSRVENAYVIADDSGIFIDALGGMPGVITAEWAGKGAPSQVLMEHALNEMKDVPEGERTAYFESVVAVRAPSGDLKLFTGRVYGRIPLKPRGEMLPGLPFTPIFIPEGENKTWAEMPLEEINRTSHRGKAFAQVREFLLSKL
jgi:XTP/dITP diphosphohydrolase